MVFHWDGDSWCFGDFHLLRSSGSFCLIKPVPALWLWRLLTWSAPPNLQRCLSSFVARNELCSAGIDAASWFGEHRWFLGRSSSCALLCCLVRVFIGTAWSHVNMCRVAARQSAGSIKAVWHRLPSLSCSLGAMALELHVMWEHDAVTRERARVVQALMQWPTVHGRQLLGVPSKRSFLMNTRVLEISARWWCPQVEDPQTAQIPKIKEQARQTWWNLFFPVLTRQSCSLARTGDQIQTPPGTWLARLGGNQCGLLGIEENLELRAEEVAFGGKQAQRPLAYVS